MDEKIKEISDRINNEFSNGAKFNNKDVRMELKNRLEQELPECTIKCNEENNPPELIDLCCIAARASWMENHQEKEYILVFGQKEQVNIAYRNIFDLEADE